MSRRAVFVDVLSRILPIGVAAFTASQTPLANAGGVLNGIVDVGSGQNDLMMYVDVAAIAAAAADQSYDIVVQGSNVITFASGVEELARMRMGNTALRNGAQTTLPGRYEMQVSNQQNSIEYRFMRVLLVIAGTGPSIQFSSLWLQPQVPIQ